ncbi:MAG: Tfp pilus assembly protein FimT/FimU [Acidobacteriota bacterium]
MCVRARSACGFSLIELLLVVVILAIVATFAAPALRGTMTAYRLRISADIIIGELDAARVLAISRGAVYRVNFTSGTVAVVDPQDASHPPRRPKNLEEGVQITLSSSIDFMPRGTCSGGQIQLQNESGMASILVSGTGKMTVSMGGSYTTTED